MSPARIAALLAIAIALGAGPAPATGPASQPAMTAADPAVAGLVRQLDADDWQARDAAAEQLVAKGEAVRPAMVDAAAHAESPEVRSRAAGVVAKLDQARAERPTTVTLHLKNVNPREAFAAMAKQGGMPLPIWPDQLFDPQWGGRVKPITVDEDDRPFWDAVADVCDQTGVGPRAMRVGGDVTLMQGGGAVLRGPRSVNSGRFTVIAVGVQRSRSVAFAAAGATADASDSIRFSMFADPRLPILSADLMPTLTVATDDVGRSLLPPPGRRPPGRQVNPFAGGHTVDFSAPLQLPDDGYKRLVTLTGTFHVVVPTRITHIEVADVIAGLPASHPAGPYTLNVQAAHVQDRMLICQLTVVASTEAEAAAAEHMVGGIRFEDADGQAIGTMGRGPSMHQDNHVEVMEHTIASNPIRQPVRLVWDVPLEPRDVDVPFEFHDLPLPQP